MARIVPVIDVMGGRVVRAVGGRRDLYEPIRSRLTDSTEPAVVAEALLQAAGSNELYVADLDAIQGHRPHLDWIKPFIHRGVQVMVDAGVKVAADAIPVAAVGAAIVAGTETLRGFDELAKLVGAWDASRVILSIDLRNGVVLGAEGDAASVVERGCAAGVSRFIVLELARVGTSLGPGTEDVLREVRSRFPEIELIAGGGVRGRADVTALGEAGANAVLVASALHDGGAFP
jgi:phosphoribosylformimino-5-aminoimidazole carboxamide ribotide isomerase